MPDGLIPDEVVELVASDPGRGCDSFVTETVADDSKPSGQAVAVYVFQITALARELRACREALRLADGWLCDCSDERWATEKHDETQDAIRACLPEHRPAAEEA